MNAQHYILNNKKAFANQVASSVGSTLGDAAKGNSNAIAKIIASGVGFLGTKGQNSILSASRTATVVSASRSVTNSIRQSKLISSAKSTIERAISSGGNRISVASKSAAGGKSSSQMNLRALLTSRFGKGDNGDVPNGGLPPASSGIHPDYWASVSGNINRPSIMKALRKNGSIEALATAKLIKRGDVNLKLMPTDIYGKGAAGRQPFGTKDILLSLDKISNPRQAAGFAAHETKHVLQKLTSQKYSQNVLKYETEAYRWQRKVDKKFPLQSDSEVYELLKNSPLYPSVK